MRRKPLESARKVTPFISVLQRGKPNFLPHFNDIFLASRRFAKSSWQKEFRLSLFTRIFACTSGKATGNAAPDKRQSPAV